MKDNYYAIHPQILRIDSELPFHIYLRTKEGYSRLLAQGRTYAAFIHMKIFKYSISTLYIETSQIDSYFKYLEDNMDAINVDMLISVKSKARISHELITHLAKLALAAPDLKTIERYKKHIGFLVHFIFSQGDSIKYLIPLAATSFHEYNHLVNVGIYALGLLKEVIGDDDRYNTYEIGNGFFLHDIGKYDIPEEISRKQGKLSEIEWNIMKQHPQKGYDLLRELGQMTEEIGIIVLQHHERQNGSGYPRKIRGEEIHLYSMICTIADAFDALTSQRPYRQAQSSFNALKIMQNEMLQYFDPKVFAKFVLMFSKAKQVG